MEEARKMRSILWMMTAAALGLSAACAPAVPTIDPAQIQASAVAAASTMIAQTQQAIPTETPVPPTPIPSPTPLPSPTSAALPTFPVIAAPTDVPTASTGDSCNHLLDLAATGNARAHLLIVNNTQGTMTLTLGLASKNAFGQCGYLSWAGITKNSSETVSVPQTGSGPCYWAYAWINDPKKPTTVSGGGFCMNNPDKWTLTVGYDTMHLTPP